MIDKKFFLLGALFGLVILGTYIASQPDGKLHLYFCDVGQGDASYIRLPNGSDFLIDGGPDNKVLACLGRHMPFYDREIDMIMLTHPENDHLQGLISVLERYRVKYFVIGVEGNKSEGYRRLISLIKDKNITFKNLYQGDYFMMGKVKFDVLWPQKQWIDDRFPENELVSGQTDTSVLGLSTEEGLNDFSYFVHLTYGNFDTLFTGDGDSKIQPEIIKTASLPDVEVLKFPHHGSKTGLLPEFLDIIRPEAAVISSGKNPWGHPTKEALDLLTARSIKIFRTDHKRDIEAVSDGVSWKIN